MTSGVACATASGEHGIDRERKPAVAAAATNGLREHASRVLALCFDAGVVRHRDVARNATVLTLAADTDAHQRTALAAGKIRGDHQSCRYRRRRRALCKDAVSGSALGLDLPALAQRVMLIGDGHIAGPPARATFAADVHHELRGRRFGADRHNAELREETRIAAATTEALRANADGLIALRAHGTRVGDADITTGATEPPSPPRLTFSDRVLLPPAIEPLTTMPPVPPPPPIDCALMPKAFEPSVLIEPLLATVTAAPFEPCRPCRRRARSEKCWSSLVLLVLQFVLDYLRGRGDRLRLGDASESAITAAAADGLRVDAVRTVARGRELGAVGHIDRARLAALATGTADSDGN